MSRKNLKNVVNPH